MLFFLLGICPLVHSDRVWRALLARHVRYVNANPIEVAWRTGRNYRGCGTRNQQLRISLSDLKNMPFHQQSPTGQVKFSLLSVILAQMAIQSLCYGFSGWTFDHWNVQKGEWKKRNEDATWVPGEMVQRDSMLHVSWVLRYHAHALRRGVGHNWPFGWKVVSRGVRKSWIWRWMRRGKGQKVWTLHQCSFSIGPSLKPEAKHWHQLNPKTHMLDFQMEKGQSPRVSWPAQQQLFVRNLNANGCWEIWYFNPRLS